METNAIVSVENAVTDFLLGYGKSTNDYTQYLRHACTLLTDYMIHDAPEARTEKVTVNSLGIIEMSTQCPDLIRVKDVCVGYRGEWWTMTHKNNMVTTTTTTAGVEGHDIDFGEGVAIADGVTDTFGARGGINAYYYTVDYKSRRIFIEGLVSDTVLLKYVSSGIQVSGTTYIPIMLIPMLDNYLLFKESYWIPGLVRERPMREKDFLNERLRLRNVINSLSASQWRDVMWGSFSQSPKR